MAQHDYDIANQGFPAFRSDLNNVLEAINTNNSGTSRPSSAVAGTIWLDTTNATNPTLKFYDGADDISLATLDYSANTVNWLDSVVSGGDVVDDTTPQLGGNLDVNGNSIVSVSNGNITFTPDGTGKVIIDGLSYPTADGTANQFLKTDGAGNLSFGDVDSFSNTTITSQTAETSVADNDLILISDTSAGALRKMTKANFTAGVGGGKIGQVVSATSNSSLVSTANSFVDLTGVTVSITPSSTSSKVLIITSLPLFTNSGVDIYATILRDSTNLGNATTGFGRAGKGDSANYEMHSLSAINYLDSPSTTSSITYKVQIKTSNGGTHATNTPTSVITAMEVLA